MIPETGIRCRSRRTAAGTKSAGIQEEAQAFSNLATSSYTHQETVISVQTTYGFLCTSLLFETDENCKYVS